MTDSNICKRTVHKTFSSFPPTEDACEQWRGFPMVLLGEALAASSSRRAGGTLDFLPGAPDGSTEFKSPTISREDARRKGGQKEEQKHNSVVLTVISFLCNYCTFQQYHYVYFWCLWMCFQCYGCRFYSPTYVKDLNRQSASMNPSNRRGYEDWWSENPNTSLWSNNLLIILDQSFLFLLLVIPPNWLILAVLSFIPWNRI